MSIKNSYATLSEYLNYVTDRGGNSPVPNATDDNVVEQLLEQASRYLETRTMRWFYPRVETHYFDIPDGRELFVDDDLLSVISITNGDGTTIAGTEYNLIPKNSTPHIAVKLKELTSYGWQYSTTDGSELVIGVNGYWGFHNAYTMHGWKSAGTLGAAITDTTTLAFTMTAGHTVMAGKLYKIGDELFNVTTVATNTITPMQRGDNGSTAATHLVSTVVYEWQPMEEVRNATIEITNNANHRRFGQSLRSEETVTAAGIVLSPREIPQMAKEFIRVYTRMTK